MTNNENGLFALVSKHKEKDLAFHKENLANIRKNMFGSIGTPNHDYYREWEKEYKEKIKKAEKKWDEQLDKIIQ